ncbi:MAG: SpoIIE family protein phosphatase [Peptostreptococcaceae bacterium]|nr:SpoIIE family protein phosphatase [Peptostreptococcaceae bacterium]
MDKSGAKDLKFENRMIIAYVVLLAILIGSYKFLVMRINMDENIFGQMNQNNILTWYLILEFLGIAITLMISANCYYSLLQMKRIRLVYIYAGFIFLAIMDCFYAISYAGTAVIFKNVSPHTTVTYWIVGKFVFSLLLTISSFLPLERKYSGRINIINSILTVFIGAVFILIYSGTMLVDTRSKSVFAGVLIITLQMIGAFNFTKTGMRMKNWVFIIAAFGIMMFSFNEVIFVIRGQNYGLMSIYTNAIKIIALIFIFKALFSYNINLPWIQMREAQERMKRYALDLENAIDKKTQKKNEANKHIMNEIRYAKEIQQSLLPKSNLLIRDTRFVSRYMPCENLSGDYFDIFKVDEENIGMYILDVSGHGVSAALMTMFCINTVKSTERLINRYRGLKPHRNLAHFYEAFNKMNFPPAMHMVIFFASYNFNSKILTYSSGGMNCYPILIKDDGGHVFLDKSKGFPICKCSDFYIPEYYSSRIDLRKGDRVIFYTDGLIDKQKNCVFGQTDLIDILESNRHKDIETIDRYIAERMEDNGGKIEDDITYFIMEII